MISPPQTNWSIPKSSTSPSLPNQQAAAASAQPAASANRPVPPAIWAKPAPPPASAKPAPPTSAAKPAQPGIQPPQGASKPPTQPSFDRVDINNPLAYSRGIDSYYNFFKLLNQKDSGFLSEPKAIEASIAKEKQMVLKSKLRYATSCTERRQTLNQARNDAIFLNKSYTMASFVLAGIDELEYGRY